MSILLSKTWTEIVFNNRNQNYGAYELRVNYQKNLTNALYFVNGVFVFIMLIWMNLAIYNESIPYQEITNNNNEMKFLEMNLTPINLKPIKSNLGFTPKNIISDNTNTANDHSKSIFEPSIDASIDNKYAVNADINEEKVDVNAEYPGGWESMMAYLMKNIVYDDEMKINGVNSMFVIKVKVDKDGWIYKSNRDIKIIAGGSNYLNKEIIRLIQGLERWKPAIKNNRAVKQWITIPIHVTLPSM